MGGGYEDDAGPAVRGRWGQVRFGERRLDPGPTRWEAEVAADRLGVPVRPIAVHGRGLRRRGVVCGRVRVLPAAQVTRRLRRGRRRLGGAEVAALARLAEAVFSSRRKGAPAVADPPAPPPSPAEPRPAATVVPLRDGERGLEVLLLRRSRGGTFGGVWVFPGGQVDGADAAGLAVESNDAEVAAARRAAVREAQEEAGLELDLDRLVTLSFWLTPPQAPRRFATWFFLAPAAQQPAVVVDEREIHEDCSVPPAAAMAARDAGHIDSVAPTFTTLWWLAQRGGVASALADGGARPPKRFMSRLASGPDGVRRRSGGRRRLPGRRPPPAGSAPATVDRSAGLAGGHHRLRDRREDDPAPREGGQGHRRPGVPDPAPPGFCWSRFVARPDDLVSDAVASPARLRFDPILEARRQWQVHGWGKAANGMAAVTSAFRAQQIYLARIDAILRPLGLTFARYEVADVADVQPPGRPASEQGGHPAAGPSHQRDERRQPVGARRAHHPSTPPDGRSHHPGADHPGGPAPGPRRHTGPQRRRLRGSGLDPEALEDLVSALQELRRRAGDFAVG